MHIIAQVISFIFWLVLVPFCVGLIPAKMVKPERRTPGFILLAGYFLMWSVLEVIFVPAVLFLRHNNFSTASNIFTVVILLMAAGGVWLLYRCEKEKTDRLIRMRHIAWKETPMEWILFFALVGFQLYKAVAYTSFDGDDAYYVVASLMAQQSDAMYTMLPYTGRSAVLDVRHVLAVFPMWVAFVATRSGVHATITSHVIMPLILIPLSDLLYYEIAKRLFDKKQSRAVFMIMLVLFQIFGNVSIYTNETFFLTRTWQGKSVAGNLVIPAVFWILLCIYQKKNVVKDSEEKKAEKNEKTEKSVKTEKSERGLWLLLVCINMTAGICSSIAVFLVSILLVLIAFVLALVKRSLRPAIALGLCCIPNAIYMGIYVILRYSYLW